LLGTLRPNAEVRNTIIRRKVGVWKLKRLLILCSIAGTCSGMTVMGLMRDTVMAEAHPVSVHVVHQDWQKLSQTLAQPPVDARVDRVWKAIPGLKGWSLDVAASKNATAAAHDELLHLRFHSVEPDVSLATLPTNPVYRGPKEEKSVCLMFNVSWGEAFVPGILKSLQHAHVRATFFIDGAWAQAHPDLTREIAAEGQCIGSHGNGHKDFRKLSTERLRAQMKTTNDVIASIAGVRPRAVAPPAGSFDQRAVETAHANGMYTILWTVDTIDWRKPLKQTIISRVVTKVEPGALVLMHPTEPTRQALPDLIARLKDKGYTFKTVNQLIDETPAVRPPDTLSAKS
jgi:peptidoglycan-N-acetylglucosamine deacetylase